jgi:hypothetical protein
LKNQSLKLNQSKGLKNQGLNRKKVHQMIYIKVARKSKVIKVSKKEAHHFNRVELAPEEILYHLPSNKIF